MAERAVYSRLQRAESPLTNPTKKSLTLASYDKQLIQVSKEAVLRSRELLEKTKPQDPLQLGTAAMEKSCSEPLLDVTKAEKG